MLTLVVRKALSSLVRLDKERVNCEGNDVRPPIDRAAAAAAVIITSIILL